ncbi:hypothetical protein DXG01_016234 [Tephrocybe rancida]|nr:hypothetical protein DXG01_016234 [Tephrocybe rancida]
MWERPQSREDVSLERLLISVYLVLWIRTKIVMTVREGAANIIVTPPRDEASGTRRDALTNFVRRLAVALHRHREGRMSDLERRRRTEVDEKMQDAAVRAFGSRFEKMWLIDELWTDPRFQGRGYGGALLDTATAMVKFKADWAGQSTWLQSSNVENTRFYAQHGFEPVATVLLGDQDPSWHWQPVVVTISDDSRTKMAAG